METNQTSFARYEGCLGFAVGYDLPKMADLSQLAKRLPQSVVLCTPRIIAGNQHVYSVLSQARESAKRGTLLARNGSIDLLMRITCRSQISEAIAVSEISRADKVSIFGFLRDESEMDTIDRRLREVAGDIVRNDRLLMLTKDKAKFLKRLHNLPAWLNDDQLLVALGERSALLILDK